MNAYQLWVSFSGLIRREVRRYFRIWPQTLLPSAITMALYFMIFGQVIGHRIGLMAGIPYMVFITPGLIMMAVINNSYANVVSSFFGSRFNRSFEEMQVSPMPSSLIVLGFCVGGMTRGLCVGVIVLFVSTFFAGWHDAHVALTILSIVLASLFFALAGFMNGMFARKFDDVTIVPTFILTPLIYLGGVFYNIKTLSPFWQKLSLINPIHYIIDLFRYSMLNINPGSAWHELFGIFVLVAILFSINVWMLHKGVRVRQ